MGAASCCQHNAEKDLFVGNDYYLKRYQFDRVEEQDADYKTQPVREQFEAEDGKPLDLFRL
jgi:hypothetical protein